MSSDETERNPEDRFAEHGLHGERPDAKCSECWKVLRNHVCVLRHPGGESCKTCLLFASIK